MKRIGQAATCHGKQRFLLLFLLLLLLFHGLLLFAGPVLEERDKSRFHNGQARLSQQHKSKQTRRDQIYGLSQTHTRSQSQGVGKEEQVGEGEGGAGGVRVVVKMVVGVEGKGVGWGLGMRRLHGKRSEQAISYYCRSLLLFFFFFFFFLSRLRPTL